MPFAATSCKHKGASQRLRNLGQVESLCALECRADEEAVADGVAHLHAVQADDPGSNRLLAGTDPNIGRRIRGLKTSVGDNLSVGGMDRSSKGCCENEKNVCFHFGLGFQFCCVVQLDKSSVFLFLLGTRHWKYTENPPALDKQSERIGNPSQKFGIERGFVDLRPFRNALGRESGRGVGC